MKKVVLVTIILFVGSTSYAQELGIRFGPYFGGHYSDRYGGHFSDNVAVDGVFSIGKFSRVHGDIAFGGGSVGLSALIDFLYKPIAGDDNFRWYVGAGASAVLGDPFYLGASGELGIEYRIPTAPISISADWRPNFWIVSETRLGADSFGINVRYVF